MKKTNLFFYVCAVSILCFAGVSHAFELSKSQTITEHLDGFTVTKRGKLSAVERVKVELVKGKMVEVKSFAQKAFAGVNAFEKELKGKDAAGLLKNSIKTDTFGAETADFILIAKSVTATITNTSSIKGRSKWFKSLLGKQKKLNAKTFKLSELPKEWNKGLDAFVAEARKLPASHPWKKAVDAGGKKALVVSAFNGEGDITLIEELVIPKKLGEFRKGKTGFYNFDYGNSKVAAGIDARTKVVYSDVDGGWAVGPKAKGKVKTIVPIKARKEKVAPGKAKTATSGQSTKSYNFVTGPRFHNDFEKTYTLDFGVGSFSVQGRWGYDFGFMVPVKVTSTMRPTSVTSKRTGVESRPMWT